MECYGKRVASNIIQRWTKSTSDQDNLSPRGGCSEFRNNRVHTVGQCRMPSHGPAE